MRFTITSGTGIREIVDRRDHAASAYKHVMALVSAKRSSIRIFDEDGLPVDLKRLRRLADEESVKAH